MVPMGLILPGSKGRAVAPTGNCVLPVGGGGGGIAAPDGIGIGGIVGVGKPGFENDGGLFPVPGIGNAGAAGAELGNDGGGGRPEPEGIGMGGIVGVGKPGFEKDGGLGGGPAIFSGFPAGNAGGGAPAGA
jgi:hypothetical protein